ncbi:MAG TPA: CGNR zinc finger domain-containing protein, partial [Alphaproteobacteria bacterium]|nr:CGNR zinc finger domain-containing protein [Alphaproteobacteria bacterium]
CGGIDCGWLFLDTSKNAKRRWCDMRYCGNRAKAHRHYERARAGGRTEGT